MANVNELAEVNGFEIPDWTKTPPEGSHIDVIKNDEVIQKIMLDSKMVNVFGRNKTHANILIDHESCSRAHALLLWHGDIHKYFLVDLGSSHGTFIDSQRIPAKEIMRLDKNSRFSFGASTRQYCLRNKIQPNKARKSISENTQITTEPADLLPDTLDELENQALYNTTQNQMASIAAIDAKVSKKRIARAIKPTFSDKLQIYRSSIEFFKSGRFKNMVKTSIIRNSDNDSIPASKKAKESNLEPVQINVNFSSGTSSQISGEKPFKNKVNYSLYSQLGIRLPELAPDLESEPKEAIATDNTHSFHSHGKKYAKEHWQGPSMANTAPNFA